MSFNFPGYWGDTKTMLVGTLDASGSNTVSLAFGQPVEVKRLILVNTVVHTVANAKLTVGVRDRDDSPTADPSAYTLVPSGSAKAAGFPLDLGPPDPAPV